MSSICIWTLSDEQISFVDPRPSAVDPFDLAHAMAKECRFANQIAEHYSVAEHSVLVEKIAVARGLKSRGGRMWALLHDAHEAYTRDIPMPLKLELAPLLKPIERRLDQAIRTRFQLQDIDPAELALIEQADLIALATEKRALRVDPLRSWAVLDGISPCSEAIHCWKPSLAASAWLSAFLLHYTQGPA